MAEKEPVGKVTHFFDKISVAVIELTGSLKAGDKIEIETKEGPFQQEVTSMQVDHKPVEKAKKGDAIGMKVDNPVKEGNPVSKLAE
jgi:translation elongation factor EF-1alpha